MGDCDSNRFDDDLDLPIALPFGDIFGDILGDIFGESCDILCGFGDRFGGILGDCGDRFGDSPISPFDAKPTPPFGDNPIPFDVKPIPVDAKSIWYEVLSFDDNCIIVDLFDLVGVGGVSLVRLVLAKWTLLGVKILVLCLLFDLCGGMDLCGVVVVDVRGVEVVDGTLL